ncbi:hypothetical protein F2P56_024507 [Juglans regia]|uniref:Uncharacterized protein n=2 Tax=Juglans regia TaxID=51240 RepID=A0A833UN30_JUGRE|nr:pectinesterase inhibitor 10-like [Juglans regia]KAF5454874.1 hypothetical protein F2P56_024507 [Juglans regia]
MLSNAWISIRVGCISLVTSLFGENLLPFTNATPIAHVAAPTPCSAGPPPPSVPPIHIVPSNDPPITPSAPDAHAVLTPSSAPSMSSSSTASNSSCYESPLPIALAPSLRTHPTVTRAQNNIFCPKQLSITTKHPLTPTLEPTCVSQAL